MTTPRPDPLVGQMLDGRYEIQARVGEGGMGVVYRARQISIDRVIALKMLNPQMASDPTWVQRFYNEAKACSRLQHPNTIRMFDFGQTQDGRLYMSMEFLDGISLRGALQPGPFPPQRVLNVLIACCGSLAEAHAIGIIHRDIKPDNVFLLNMAGSPDFVKLLDFSVAKLLEGDRLKTQAGVVFGTPQYMSPEQARAMPLDARSDLYALGVLAFEMLVGTVPFHDENPMTVIQMQMQSPMPALPPHLPYSIQQIVIRAMDKDPARRYQTASEMMQHCQQVFAELASAQAPTMTPYPPAMPHAARTMIGQESPFAPMAHQQAMHTPQGQYAQQPMHTPQGPYAQQPMMQPQMMQQPPMQPQMPHGTPGGYPMQQPQAQLDYQKSPLQYPQYERPASVPTPRQPTPAARPSKPPAAGASTLFWILSLVFGIALGVVAYVIVVQLS
jgi:serine/threonine-protein kinase|nr:protein kinase [Kofleriaceae bacterium]